MASIDGLRGLLAQMGPVVVAFSGGVDSSLVADVAHEVLGADADIVTAVSPALAPRERADARALASTRGWHHREIDTFELDRDGYRANAGDRCYFCKDTLFSTLSALGAAGPTVVTGTNLDDLGDHRPGLRAAREHGVRAPLVEAGFDKAAVRAAASARGLPNADKPATPCLASRIAYGIEVTPERLARIAAAEAVIYGYGFSDLRVRDHGTLARIEVPKDELVLLDLAVRTSIEAALLELGFAVVEVDPRGLVSGGMNAVLTKIERARP